MARSRRNLNDSRPQSPIDDSSDEQEAKSPQETPRGRTGNKQTKSEPTVETAG
jgi:choline-phosphate cytidylyltransferase